MEPIHIFFTKNYLKMKTTFLQQILQKNELENLKFKKSQEYVVIGLSINQDTGSELVTVIDLN